MLSKNKGFVIVIMDIQHTNMIWNSSYCLGDS